MLLLSKVGINS